ncbi:hypothetical protein [Acidimangrovimonas sediminis]|uniref:hypothetical protein n=1 Tax=Acidimangrovimonas sediminis TaxID=2056283 RepID=UPI000C809FA3|nr:hypothetical protein [Acidimangrovimonas sediminis]
MTVEIQEHGALGLVLLDEGRVVARAKLDLATHCWRLSLFKCCWLERDPGSDQFELLRRHGLSVRSAAAVRILESRDDVLSILRGFLVD